MKKNNSLKVVFFTLIILAPYLSNQAFSQGTGSFMSQLKDLDMGDETCSPPPGGPITENDDDGGFLDFFFDITVPSDPNAIISPTGYDAARWVSINDHMGFTIMFENDPKVATAPAHDVYIFYPINQHQDINTFRLGNFGFNQFVFNVPNNPPFYSTRLDLRDSLGLYVDVTAGIDVVNNRAFWIFQSIDPATGLSPVNPNLGFLPIKDSTLTALNDTVPIEGEGFVTFSINPKLTSQTRDTIFATAKIVFDDNDTIPTNTEFNTIDAMPPVSAITAAAVVSNTVTLQINAADDPNASGVKSYDLYVAQDSSNFISYLSNSTNNTVSFTGTSGSQYHFFTLATDNTGNREVLKSSPDTSITFNSGIKWFADADSDGYGNAFVTIIAETQPPGYVADSMDCNDAATAIHPGASEICNGIDDNCNGQIDEGNVTPASAGVITGPVYVCVNQSPFVYTVPVINGATFYKWKLPTGMTPVSGSTTTSIPSITVQTSGAFNGGTINVKGINLCDSGAVSPNITLFKTTSKPSFPEPINAKTGTAYEFCAGNTYLLTTTSQRATSFTWSASNWNGATGSLLPNPVINNPLVTGSALLQLPSGFTSVTIDVVASNCNGTTTPRRLIIKSLPGQPPALTALSGNKIICPLNADYSFGFNGIVSGANSLHWVATGDVSPSSIINNLSTATFHFNSGFTTGSIKVSGTNLCGEGPQRSLTGLTKAPAAPVVINGPSSICKISNPVGTFSIAAVVGATNYTWSSTSPNIKFNDGVQPPANPLTTVLLQVSVNFSSVAAGNRNIKVRSNNSCESSSTKSKSVVNNSCREGENTLPENLIEIFPVPASQELHIQFSANAHERGKLNLLDVTGRQVKVETFETVEGENILTWDVSQLSAGIYTLQFIMGEKRESTLVVIN